MPVPGRKRGLRSAACTSVGRVRENNEDSIHVNASDDFVIAVVADGMGGAAAGEEASRLAVEAIKAGLETLPADDAEASMKTEQIAQKLRTVIRAGNDSIVQRAIHNPQLRGMGTTVTLAYVRQNQAVIAHVGDSRAYLISNYSLPRIQQITADHSFVDALVHAGHLTQEQADEHPMRHVLYRALGQTEELDIDVYQTRLRPGDRIVLCSDGLTRHVKPNEIADTVLETEDPTEACQQLVDLANARGGEDNVSVIVTVVDGDLRIDETPMIVVTTQMSYSDEDVDTIPFNPNSTMELDPLPMVDENSAPSPESPNEDTTLPDRDQLDKRARLLQLQFLIDEILLDPDPLDNAISSRSHLESEPVVIRRRAPIAGEDSTDPRTPRQ